MIVLLVATSWMAIENSISAHEGKSFVMTACPGSGTQKWETGMIGGSRDETPSWATT